MDRRQREVEQQMHAFGIVFKLIRQKKHFVYHAVLPDGRETSLVFSKSPSDPNRMRTSERSIRKLLAGIAT